MADQYFKVGKVLKITGKDNVERKKVKLGQEGSKDPKYDYTVQVRILEGNPRTKEELNKAKVVGVFVNPWIDLNKPHPNAPETVLSELQIYKKEII